MCSSDLDLARGSTITTTATAVANDTVISGAVDINVTGAGTVNLVGEIVTTGDTSNAAAAAGGAVTIDTANGVVKVSDITTTGGAASAGSNDGGAAGAITITTGTNNVITLDSSTLTDQKSTRLNSSHVVISYAVFCLKKKTMHYSSPYFLTSHTPRPFHNPP